MLLLTKEQGLTFFIKNDVSEFTFGVYGGFKSIRISDTFDYQSLQF